MKSKKTKRNMRSKSKQNKSSSRSRRNMQTKQTKQTGGSPAYDLVMKATTRPSSRQDYVTSPRTRDKWAFDEYTTTDCQGGGGVASNMVTNVLNSKAETAAYDKPFNVSGNIDSLNLYKLTGGRNHNRKAIHKNKYKHKNKSKSNNNSSKSNKSKYSKRSKHSKYQMHGGFASDWISSQYSLGSANAAEQSADYVKQFSNSEAGMRSSYMNPPNLGLAGSGGAVGDLEGSSGSITGAPLV